MKFGIFFLMTQRDPSVPASEVFAQTVEQVALADEVGLDFAWFAEHHFSNYGLCPSPLLMAAHCASVTRSIRLGTGVVVLPLYDPIRLIEEIATVDVLTDGRLDIGIGSGYQQYEFERFGASLDESIDRSLEMLDIMELAYTEETFSYEGEFYRIPPTAIPVKPVQKPMPDVFIAGMLRDERVRHRLVDKGYLTVTSTWTDSRRLMESREDFEGIYRDRGRDPGGLRMGALRSLAITDDPDEAAAAADHVRFAYRVAQATRGGYEEVEGAVHGEVPAEGEPIIEEILAQQPIGDVDKVVGQLATEVEDWQPSHLAFSMDLVSHQATMRSIERLAAEVIPGLEARAGPIR